MKSNRINYVLVGAFVITMVVGLVVAVAVLSGRTGAMDTYFVTYDNVSGVKFGTQVLYEGYAIGQVEDIQPREEMGRMRFRIELSLREGWRIPEDSIAMIAASGLLSAVVVNIDAGTSQIALVPGSDIPGREGANIFTVMSTVAGEISELARNDIKPLLATLKDTVNTVGGLLDAEGQTLIKEVTALVGDVSERAPRIVENIETFSARMSTTSEEIAAVITPENREKLQTLIDNMDVTAKNFTQLSVNLDRLAMTLDELVTRHGDDVGKSVEQVRYVLDSLARHIDSVNQNLEGTSRNMYEFSRQIRQNPAVLLGGKPPPDEGGGRR